MPCQIYENLDKSCQISPNISKSWRIVRRTCWGIVEDRKVFANCAKSCQILGVWRILSNLGISPNLAKCCQIWQCLGESHQMYAYISESCEISPSLIKFWQILPNLAESRQILAMSIQTLSNFRVSLNRYVATHVIMISSIMDTVRFVGLYALGV